MPAKTPQSALESLQSPSEGVGGSKPLPWVLGGA